MYALEGYYDGNEIKFLKTAPLKKGDRVIVTVLDPDEDLDYLISAQEKSLVFWDNKKDDEVWNKQ